MKNTPYKTIDDCIKECERRQTGMVHIVKDGKIFVFLSNECYNDLATKAGDAVHVRKKLGDKEFDRLVFSQLEKE